MSDWGCPMGVSSSVMMDKWSKLRRCEQEHLVILPLILAPHKVSHGKGALRGRTSIVWLQKYWGEKSFLRINTVQICKSATYPPIWLHLPNVDSLKFLRLDNQSVKFGFMQPLFQITVQYLLQKKPAASYFSW